MRSRTAFVLLLSLCIWTPPTGNGVRAQDAQAPADLDALLQGFRGMSGLSAKFREEKSVALLAVPIRSEGEIHFAQPGLLVRRVTAPVASTALIARGRLVMVSGGRRQEIDLSGNPVVSGFVDSFRHVLAGDRAALERAYQVRLTSEGAEWSLELRPRGAPLDQFLTRMVLVGRGNRVTRMEMVEASGDVTRTEFFDVRDRTWSAAERRRTFEL